MIGKCQLLIANNIGDTRSISHYYKIIIIINIFNNY